ncbi:acyl-CoA desaturase [Marivirga sp. S37H4]|uniref:Acyl-CoA desaturase n=1 Tax=Marivirga aurantiaca TaxID=2802615 RepID=A0A934X355_9BACT|nr:acyl-CoA desaturase [Marivirga aurantiaca]MBK6267391.1 acyl-CoA desaturase [Marivirga aurantiaca]
MPAKTIKFNANDNPEFVSELRENVNQYFKTNKISKHANLSMKIKTIVMISLYFIPLGILLSGVVSTLLPTIVLFIFMGFGMAGIGLCIMHDANHSSYSKNKLVNKSLGFLANFLGAYHINWKIQHNVLHHSFTNIEDFDEDIDKKGIIRFSPLQKRKKIFAAQAYYAPLLYGFMTFYWLVAKDIDQLIRYNKKDLLSAQGITFKSGILSVLFNKFWYIGLTLVLPILATGIIWWQVLLGFLLMQFISGLILALVFQPAHVIEATNFYKADENGSMENNWAIHQFQTTSNFANSSAWFSWIVGGLNHQIEHHVFPNICHIHYRDIAPIVKKTAEKYNVPYHHHKSFGSALKSHFTLLNKLGTGTFDKELVEFERRQAVMA